MTLGSSAQKFLFMTFTLSDYMLNSLEILCSDVLGCVFSIFTFILFLKQVRQQYLVFFKNYRLNLHIKIRKIKKTLLVNKDRVRIPWFVFHASAMFGLINYLYEPLKFAILATILLPGFAV